MIKNTCLFIIVMIIICLCIEESKKALSQNFIKTEDIIFEVIEYNVSKEIWEIDLR